MALEYLAGISGATQALGYLIYIWYVLRRKIEPNPTSWFMWAYGTALLALLEADLGAPLALLILPIVCSISSVILAVICWQRGTLKWPEHRLDALAFVADVVLTIAYVASWVLLKRELLTKEEQQLVALISLILTNATVLTSFGPMLREVLEEPEDEQTAPWVVWTLAYAMLTLVTFMSGEGPEFFIYPLMNFVVHTTIATLVFFGRRRRLGAASR